MDSDSDEELPSLSAIVSRFQQQKLAVTSVTREHSPVEDPAEQAIVPRPRVKLRTTLVQPIARSTSKSKIHGNANFTDAFGRASTSSKQTTQSTPLKTGSASKAVALCIEGSHDHMPANGAQGTNARRAPAASPAQIVVSASDRLQAGSLQEHIAAPRIHIEEDLFGKEQEVHKRASPLALSNTPGHAKTASPAVSHAITPEPAHESTSNSHLPVTPKTTKEAENARKKRRVTIITISDSEDDVDPPPLPTRSRSPSRTPSLVNEEPSEEQDELAEEVSFADYSDSENGGTEATAKKPPPARRVIEIDSSDSEYDGTAGVITWNPTPNKVKNIIKSSTVLLAPLPLSATVNIPSRNTVVQNFVLPPSTPRPTDKEGDKNELRAIKSKAKVPSLEVKQPAAAPSTPRTSKKANPFVKQRDELAMNLVEELNSSVFNNQLPEDLTIVWNGRLNTTAGRANWKKTTNKATNTTSNRAEIELSIKVIDSEEKLRCTLAHELCHVAAWAVDQEMKPAHGPAFKSWGRKVMRARHDIKVTTKHSYEIAFKYQWQCTQASCGKIYGRHSNSIDPTRHACGACSSRLVRLDKNGQPVVAATGAASTPRKESEWAIFSRSTFKRIKIEQPSLSMTQINKLVAAEWAEVKAKKALQTAGPALLANQLGGLAI